eukprot:g40494.t1
MWQLYKGCLEMIKTLEQGDDNQRKIEEFEEERRKKYLKTRYDQASWTLESMGFNPDEEEEMEECCKNKRQRTNYLS